MISKKAIEKFSPEFVAQVENEILNKEIKNENVCVSFTFGNLMYFANKIKEVYHDLRERKLSKHKHHN